MESLAPPLQCLIEIQSALQNGETVRSGLQRYIQSDSKEFANDVRRFLFDWDQGRDWREFIRSIPSPYRRALFELVACALDGQSVQGLLQELRKEIEDACELEMKSHLEMLPLRMLFPLLLLLFPSYLLLLFGPVLASFFKELSG